MARRGEGARRRLRFSIAAALTLGLGGLMLAALAAVALVTLGVSERNTTDLLRKFSEVTIGSINLQIDRYIRNVRSQAEFVAEAVGSGRIPFSDRNGLADLMAGSLAGVPQARGMAVFQSSGPVLRVGRVDGELKVADGDWRQDDSLRGFMERAEAGRIDGLRTVVWVPSLHESTVAVDAPVLRDGRFLGAVSSVVGLMELSRFVKELSDEYEGTAFILYGHDHVLAHPFLAGGMRGLSADHPLPTLGEVQDPVLMHIWDEPSDRLEDLLEGTDLSGHLVEVGDRLVVYVYKEVQGLSDEPWVIGAYFDGDAVGAPIRRLIASGLVALGIMAVSLLLAVLLGRAIARPITRLAQSATAVESLDFTRVPPPPRSFFREIDVAGQSFQAMLDGLRLFETYLPKRLVARLLVLGSAATRSESRDVTVLFTDIVGFTSLSETLEAEGIADFLNRHFGLLGACIEAEQGTIDKYIGDSVMAFWGAPLDQEDHAERACRAALAIAGAIAADNERRRAEGLRPVQLRIGVHSGEAIVGNIGAQGRVNYTLVGDTVNIAQRLEGLGHEYPSPEPVQILISDDTRERLGAAFETEPLGRVRLRGRHQGTAVFRLKACAEPIAAAASPAAVTPPAADPAARRSAP